MRHRRWSLTNDNIIARVFSALGISRVSCRWIPLNCCKKTEGKPVALSGENTLSWTCHVRGPCCYNFGRVKNPARSLENRLYRPLCGVCCMRHWIAATRAMVSLPSSCSCGTKFCYVQCEFRMEAQIMARDVRIWKEALI